MLETEHTTLLIDAGLGKKEMVRRFEALGRSFPERVDGVLCTHEHSDHSSALAQLARHWNCPAYLTEPTHRKIVEMYADDPEKPGKKATIDHVEYVQGGKKFQIGDIEVSPFDIPHDAKDPVAFSFRSNGTKVAIVTDLGFLPVHVKLHLREVDFLMLESNHDVEKLKMGPYPWHIKLRIKGAEGAPVENEDAVEFLADAEVFDGAARVSLVSSASLGAEQRSQSRPALRCAGSRQPPRRVRLSRHIACCLARHSSWAVRAVAIDEETAWRHLQRVEQASSSKLSLGTDVGMFAPIVLAKIEGEHTPRVGKENTTKDSLVCGLFMTGPCWDASL